VGRADRRVAVAEGERGEPDAARGDLDAGSGHLRSPSDHFQGAGPSIDHETDRHVTPKTHVARLLSRAGLNWRRFRVVLTVAVVAVAGYFVGERTSDLRAAGHILARVSWHWLGLAVLFEAASIVVFARLQRLLLRAGGVRLRLRTLVEITVAGNAVSATLPGGVAWAASWAFGQLKRRGVDPFLRVWVFLVAGAVSSFALFLVVFAGIEFAGGRGPVANLRWAALALASIPVAAVMAGGVRHTRPARALGSWIIRELDSVPGGRWLVRSVRAVVTRVGAIHMGPLRWAQVLGFALLNWLYDCMVLVVSLVALHVPVPWRGIFVVYGLTQIAATIPITPGGLGVVEGGLVALLHAYGVPTEQAFAVTILFRIVSFWGLVPIGWVVWVALDVRQRHGLRPGRAHPWAFHRHAIAEAGTNGRRSDRLRVLPSPAPCEGCDQREGDAPAVKDELSQWTAGRSA